VWRKVEAGSVARNVDCDLIRIATLWAALRDSGDNVEVMTAAYDVGVFVGCGFQQHLVEAFEWAAGDFTTINVITDGGCGAVIPIESYRVSTSGAGSGDSGIRSGANDGKCYRRQAGG
jgi:hypothetical protein